MQLTSKGLSLSLDRPHVMGILNVTPDSFSDGGNFNQFERAMAHARQMVSDGATLIDIGGESTRPGAPDVSEQEELDRVIPVVEQMVRELDVMISLDTSKAAVMREGCKAGAHLINDVRALQEPGALQAAAEARVPVCLMHMQGQPRTMQVEPLYDDLIGRYAPSLMSVLRLVWRSGSVVKSCCWIRDMALAKPLHTTISCWRLKRNCLIMACRYWWGCRESL